MQTQIKALFSALHIVVVVVPCFGYDWYGDDWHGVAFLGEDFAGASHLLSVLGANLFGRQTALLTVIQTLVNHGSEVAIWRHVHVTERRLANTHPVHAHLKQTDDPSSPMHTGRASSFARTFQSKNLVIACVLCEHSCLQQSLRNLVHLPVILHPV